MTSKWLKALVLCSILQIVTSLGAMVSLSEHNSAMTREYTFLAEQNAHAFTSASVLDLYNQIQREMQNNRLATTKEITRAIELNNARRDSPILQENQ